MILIMINLLIAIKLRKYIYRNFIEQFPFILFQGRVLISADLITYFCYNIFITETSNPNPYSATWEWVSNEYQEFTSRYKLNLNPNSDQLISSLYEIQWWIINRFRSFSCNKAPCTSRPFNNIFILYIFDVNFCSHEVKYDTPSHTDCHLTSRFMATAYCLTAVGFTSFFEISLVGLFL